MSVVDNRLRPERAKAVHIDEAIATLPGITASSTLTEVYAAITAEYTDPKTCAQCAGVGYITAYNDVQHYFNDTEDTLVDEAGNVNPAVICPLCGGDQVTEGDYTVSAGRPTGYTAVAP